MYSIERKVGCFRFRNKFQFQIFEQLSASLSRIHGYTLVHQSLELELEMQKMKEKNIEEFHSYMMQQNNDKTSFDQKSLPKNTNRAILHDSFSPHPNTRIQYNCPNSMGRNSTSNSLRGVAMCVLCSQKDFCSTHPYVYADGNNNRLFLCNTCAIELEGRRRNLDKVNGLIIDGEASEEVCGICADGGRERGLSLICCSEKECVRVYCISCLSKILAPTQMKEMESKDDWYCPNCFDFVRNKRYPDAPKVLNTVRTTLLKRPIRNKLFDNHGISNILINDRRKDEVVQRKPEYIDKNTNMKEIKKSSHAARSKKRGLDIQAGPNLLSVQGKKEEKIDYFLQYLLNTVRRESNSELMKDSEDACFCCKDGGDVVECDHFRIVKKKRFKCPKVYHVGESGCYAYSIPENQHWKCPRHFCKQCGNDAAMCCRFCTTSYCKSHFPKKIDVIGKGTNDISPFVYIICDECELSRIERVKSGKILKNAGIGDVSPLTEAQSFELGNSNYAKLIFRYSNGRKKHKHIIYTDRSNVFKNTNEPPEKKVVKRSKERDSNLRKETDATVKNQEIKIESESAVNCASQNIEGESNFPQFFSTTKVKKFSSSR